MECPPNKICFTNYGFLIFSVVVILGLTYFFTMNQNMILEKQNVLESKITNPIVIKERKKNMRVSSSAHPLRKVFGFNNPVTTMANRIPASQINNFQPRRNLL